MTDRFEVIPSGLLVAQMGVERGVTSSTSQVLTVTERDMLTVRRLEALGETEIDDIDGVLCLVVASNQKVIGLYVTMNDAFLVHDLDALDQLHGDVQYCP